MKYLMSIRFTQEVPISETHYESASHFQEAKVGDDEFSGTDRAITWLAKAEKALEVTAVATSALQAFLRRIYPIVDEGHSYDLMVQFREWDDLEPCPNYMEPSRPALLTVVFEVLDGLILGVNATVKSDDTEHDEVPVVQPIKSVAGTKP